MALTEDQLIDIRREIGDEPDEATLNEIYSRTGDLDELILEVLEIRYANLLRTPAQFAVAGEYSQNTAENMKDLKDKIASRGGALGTVVFVSPPDARIR